MHTYTRNNETNERSTAISYECHHILFFRRMQLDDLSFDEADDSEDEDETMLLQDEESSFMGEVGDMHDDTDACNIDSNRNSNRRSLRINSTLPNNDTVEDKHSAEQTQGDIDPQTVSIISTIQKEIIDKAVKTSKIQRQQGHYTFTQSS
eukprot:CAMPEP_0185734350 /NCGR_PEP_ID=MMETSP1171-20130828/22237_1 /TAXON_ID=374046 /ORGANISM="Helicotheca tamensis, Strain CCMP826" /LENGTH=149 /DNA_ID=CAMNT_0028404323 /DNA_START=177 /DNA_END=626 /DNA_ORIENTATION=-